MKYTLILSLLALVACTSTIKDQMSEKEIPLLDSAKLVGEFRPQANGNFVINKREDLIGYWVGWFMPDVPDSSRQYIYTGEHSPWDFANKINVSIDEIRGDSIIGHSVVASNFRPFRGVLKESSTSYDIKVSEPGDDRYDGNFIFSIAKNDSQLLGTWKAYKTLKISKRKYSLQKRNFKYDSNSKLDGSYVNWEKFKKPDYEPSNDILTMDKSEKSTREYIVKSLIDVELKDITDKNIDSFIEEVRLNDEFDEVYYRKFFTTTEKASKLNPSAKLLTKQQVENLSKADIYVLRNSIYARHGYSFKNRQLRAYFDRQEWYIPVHANIKSDFTEIEKQNIKLLLLYEEHAEEYYDEFGRG